MYSTHLLTLTAIWLAFTNCTAVLPRLRSPLQQFYTNFFQHLHTLAQCTLHTPLLVESSKSLTLQLLGLTEITEPACRAAHGPHQPGLL